jgi:hypothetical protein
MRKLLLGGLLLGSLAVVPAAFAGTNVGVSILIGNAPPPPRVVYVREPRWEYIPEERVYVVDDDALPYDYFRYGAYVYIYNGGYWYRSASYRGPFVAIRREYVPGPIFYVGSNHYRWRHHPEWVPPGHRREMVVDEDRGEGRGHGNGHGKHGKHDD